MKLSFQIAVVAISATLASAGAFCGQWDSVTTSKYRIYNNLWGRNDAYSGSQCTGLNSSSSSDTVSWYTTWDWQGNPAKVKSFANANLIFTPKRIRDIASIPSVLSYSYSGNSDVVCNVAYDIFTHPTAGSKVSEYEIMIWTAAYGHAGPIGKEVIASVTIQGYKWKLYDGYNGAMRVFSFVAPKPITSFKGDAKAFLDYLVKKFKLPSSQFINVIQAGTEPFVGTKAKLNVNAFSVSVK